MSVDVLVPAMEMDQGTVVLIEWFKAEGDYVEVGEPLMELETNKANVVIEATASGYLVDVSVAADTEVQVGVVVARIVDRVEDAAAVPPAPAPPAPAPAAAAPAPAPAEELPYDVVALTRVETTSAQRLAQSYRDAVHFSVGLTVDAGPMLAWVAEARAAAVATRPPTVTATLARLVAVCLDADPRLNSHFVDGELRAFRPVHLGVATATDEGLRVVVLRDAAGKDVARLGADLADLTARAREGRLSLEDGQGSTFTITNLGMLGVDRFTAILNPPEVGILTLGRVRESGDPAQPVVEINLVADHRAVDGAAAARFLKRLEQLMLDPAPHMGVDREAAR